MSPKDKLLGTGPMDQDSPTVYTSVSCLVDVHWGNFMSLGKLDVLTSLDIPK